jgi:hypothetical protein
MAAMQGGNAARAALMQGRGKCRESDIIAGRKNE